VREALAPYVPRGGTIAAARATHPGRYVGIAIDPRGRAIAVAKVASDEEGRGALAAEARSLRTLGPSLPPPLASPSLLETRDGVVIVEAVPWLPRREPWVCEEEVAFALGVFHREGRGADGLGPAHGDLAPWNLLRTRSGWVLVDWESAVERAEPWLDVCHFVVQAHSLLGRPEPSEVLDGFVHRRGWVGRAVAAYATGSGLDPSGAAPALRTYLARPDSAGVARSANEHRGLRRRAGLLESLPR
jgi:hypothetical protein